jgi:HAE1 family hydrophobic/amphiphilic exporter-1
MRYMDFTLNNMTLLALTLAVGIVIDDAIIVLENIFRNMEEKGIEPRRASIEATREIGLAVMATTLSLVIIFLPIAFMTGAARRYVNAFGWTMAMAIMVSLLVSFTLTHAKFAFLESPRAQERRFAAFAVLSWIEGHYWHVAGRSTGLTVLAVYALVFASIYPLYNLVGRDRFLPTTKAS